MMTRLIAMGSLAGLLCSFLSPLSAEQPPAEVLAGLPPVQREFRAAWVATVANIDWPSRPGLSTQEQRAEMIALLDDAARLNLNAVILQVRPSCDAIYPSELEPWSEFLTGTMGQAPEPYYDPLEFAIREAHRRGIELHGWFNPYRARHTIAKGPASADHIGQTHPELVKKYAGYEWLDPGEPAATEHTLAVIRDVVTRYDIDGIHMDDYFYPYPVNDDEGQARSLSGRSELGKSGRRGDQARTRRLAERERQSNWSGGCMRRSKRPNPG